MTTSAPSWLTITDRDPRAEAIKSGKQVNDE